MATENMLDVCSACNRTRAYHKENRPRHPFMRKPNLADELAELERLAPLKRHEKARAEADKYVKEMYESCVTKARTDAREGYGSSTCPVRVPMTHGNSVTRETMVEELVARLRADGLTVEVTEDYEYDGGLKRSSKSTFIKMLWG
jgi:hypothetical protein